MLPSYIPTSSRRATRPEAKASVDRERFGTLLTRLAHVDSPGGENEVARRHTRDIVSVMCFSPFFMAVSPILSNIIIVEEERTSPARLVESKRGERTTPSASRRTSPAEAPPGPAASGHPSHPAIASMTILPPPRPHVPCPPPLAPSFVCISYLIYGHTCAHSYQHPASCFSNLTTTTTT